MSFHFFRVNEVFSNADGTVQFIEFVGEDDGQQFWAGHKIIATSGDNPDHVYTVPKNLPNGATDGKSVLVATQGFADLGFITPDYIIPNGFLFRPGGEVVMPDMDDLSYTLLPENGTSSLGSNGTTIGTNSPRNFAGVTGTMIVGSDVVNTLTGTGAREFLAGLGGNDTLNGGGGNDTLNGGGGKDTLKGGTGNDVLKGLAAADVLTGGSGNDRFDFDAVADSGPTSSKRDRISDFQKGEDKIDLSTIDAKSGVAGNQAFDFIGTKAFSSNAKGQLRFDKDSHLLLGSTDADSAAEFSILLTGISSMTGSNFIP